MMMMMVMTSNSNSIAVGIGSLTRRRWYCCSSSQNLHAPFLVATSPIAKHPLHRSSLCLKLSTSRRSLNILSNPAGTTRTSLNVVSALNSGLEASITENNESSAALKNAIVVLESSDEDKIQLRVELTGDQTQRVFDQTLVSLGRSAPPVPGFRMAKGGKSSKIPKHFLVQMLGEERVTKFVIQEILNTTMADYAKKENLDVKDKKISTTQTAEELKRSFRAGKEFSFNVVIEPETSQEQDSS